MSLDANPVCIEGILEKIVYTSEETNFTVARLRSQENQHVTIVGTIMATNEGERIRVRGSWLKHPKYGLQINVDYFEVLLPSEKDAIIKYLASGVIKGIGSSLAERIVEMFGENTFDVLDNSPEKILDVSGIGPKKQQKILESWRAQRNTRESLVFLAKYGIYGMRAAKIHKHYGGNLVSILENHPYRLAIDIEGIGFVTADRIAGKTGIVKDDPERIQAAILHCLREATAQGHCFVPRTELLPLVSKMLQIEEDKIEENLGKITAAGMVKSPSDSNQPVYLKRLYFAEQQVAKLLHLCLHKNTQRPASEIVDMIDAFERKHRIKFRRGQQRAIQQAFSEKICVITGGPGVGKTTIINVLVDILQKKNYRVALAAPTGRAAKRLADATNYHASTIHRLLKYNPHHRSFEHNQQHPLPIDHIIVDETSMVDIHLAGNLLHAVPANASITFVGDIDQLPSVGPGNFLKDLIDSKCAAVVKLSHIFRQSQGSSIVEVAHKINDGEIPYIPNRATGDIVMVSLNNPEHGAQMIVKLVTTHMPNKFGFLPLSDIQILTPMYRGAVGANNLNALLAEALNPNGIPIGNFRKGDKVMQVVNNYEKDIYNGDIGIITSHNRIEKIVTIKFDERPVLYDETELDELVRAYAISIHKSQGSEYPAVILPLFTEHYIMLERNLLYTAVTRGKRCVVVVGNHRALQIAVSNVKARTRYTRLSKLLMSEISEIEH